MIDEKKYLAHEKQMRALAKEVKAEKEFEERQRANQVSDENEEIVNRIRTFYTKDEIRRGAYFPLKMEKDELFDKGSYEGMSVDMETIKLAIMEMDARLERLDYQMKIHIKQIDDIYRKANNVNVNICSRLDRLEMF